MQVPASGTAGQILKLTFNLISDLNIWPRQYFLYKHISWTAAASHHLGCNLSRRAGSMPRRAMEACLAIDHYPNKVRPC